MKKIICYSILIFLTISYSSIAQNKPLLSKAIQKEIDEHGIETAKKHFTKLYETKKVSFEIDMKGLSELSSTYSKDGNIKAASAVMEIASPFIQDKISSQMKRYSNAENKVQVENKKKKETQDVDDEKANKTKAANYQGETRNDLERFSGLYGDPAENNKTRRLWVRVSCDGYLVAGALWGDVAPWWLKSKSDKVFTYSDSFNKVRMEFVTDENSKAVKMIHNLKSLKNPLKWLEPLPDDMKPCLERPKR